VVRQAQTTPSLTRGLPAVYRRALTRHGPVVVDSQAAFVALRWPWRNVGLSTDSKQ
jgi:hypothetical protein